MEHDVEGENTQGGTHEERRHPQVHRSYKDSRACNTMERQGPNRKENSILVSDDEDSKGGGGGGEKNEECPMVKFTKEERKEM